MSVVVDGEETTCQVDGNDFICKLIDDVQDFGNDTQVTTALILNGNWDSSTQFEGTMAYNNVCEGPTCVDIEKGGEDFCNAEWDVEGNYGGGLEGTSY